MSTVVNAMMGTSNFGTSVSRALGFTCTTGNTVVLILRCTQTITITGDFAGATLDASSTGQSGIAISIYSLKDISTASTTLTMTLGASTSVNCEIIELQGDNDYLAGSLVRATVTPGTSVTSNVTATAAGQCVIGFSDASNARTSVTPSTNFTLLSDPWQYGAYQASVAGAGSIACGLTWNGSVNAAMVAVIYEESAASYSLTVDSGSAAGAGQSATMPVVMAAGSGSAVGEGQNSALLFDEAYVLSLSHAQATFEGQEIPFSIENQHTHAEAVFQGSDITMIADAVIAVDAADATFAGQDVAMPFQNSLAVVAAQAVFERGFATMSATGSSSGAGHAIIGMRRRRL